MNKQNLLWALLLCLLAPSLHAQTVRTAYQLSTHSPTGTARTIGMGGAFTALGGDMASMSLNPGGLALIRSTRVQLTPSLQFARSPSNYLGDGSGAGTLTNFGVSSMGVTFAGRVAGATEGLHSWAIGIGFNQLDNYYRQVDHTVDNRLNSFTNFFANQANTFTFEELGGPNPPSYYGGLGWNTSLIDTTGFIDLYEGAFEYGQIEQNVEREDRGRTNQWSLSLAGNFNNKLFIGVGVNLQSVNYDRRFRITERDLADTLYTLPGAVDTSPSMAALWEDRFGTSGVGFSGSIGLIYQPADFMRLGFSAQTPTLLNLTDVASTYVRHDFDDGETRDLETFEQTFEYQLTTPFRARAGVAFILAKKMLLSAETELTDYSSANYGSGEGGTGDFLDVNNRIEDNLGLGWAVRLGAEYRIQKTKYLRAGYAWYNSPWNEAFLEVTDPVNADNVRTGSFDRQVVSVGFGFRKKKFSLDLAYSLQFRNDFFNWYSLPEDFFNDTGQADWRFRGADPYIFAEKHLHRLDVTLKYKFGEL